MKFLENILLDLKHAGLVQSQRGAEGGYWLSLPPEDISLADVIREHGLGDSLDLERAYAAGDLLAPISHPNPANLHLTGTGLTHLGSAATRDAMPGTCGAIFSLS